MIIDVKTTKKPEDGSIAIYKDGEWVLVGKSAYLQPYMKRNDDTEKAFDSLKADFSDMRGEFAELKASFDELKAAAESTKAAINEKLAEYHEVLRILADGE